MVSLSPRQLADHHVAEARSIIANQRTLLARLGADSHFREQETGLLTAFERSLAIFEAELARIVALQGGVV
jgi:hypothetical protein